MGGSLSNILREAPEEVRNNLKCVKCTELLTCPPIILHLGEGNKCGRCCSKNDVEAGRSVRNSAFEALAKILKLPCRYKECIDLLEFDNVLSHEQYCRYRQYKCVVLSESCGWIGRRMKLKEHYMNEHADMLCNTDTALSLDLRKDFVQNIFIDELNKPFLLHIKYVARSNKLECVLFYFEKPDAEQKYSYQVSLKTKLNEDERLRNAIKEFLYTSDKCIAATSFEIKESDLFLLDLNKLEFLIEKSKEVDIKVKISMKKSN